jgi:gliding motility-associated-like protein
LPGKVKNTKRSFLKPMKKIIAILLLFIVYHANAMHNRAGEITFRLISGYSYEITVTTITNIAPAPNVVIRDSLPVYFGDNQFAMVKYTSRVRLPNYNIKNTYVVTHTYPGPGIYKIRMEDPTRNTNVSNITNSILVDFTIETVLTINGAIGPNSSPILLNQAVDKAAKNVYFIHNPNAYDPDGDSLSYRLTTCLGQNGVPIKSYTLPPASDTIYVNPRTGDLVWDKPVSLGVYNIAIAIDEWRKGVKIGTIIRDMQIEVKEADNKPPVIDPLRDYCVLAGNKITFTVNVKDSEKQLDTIIVTGIPMELKNSPASFVQTVKKLGQSSGVFTWQTDCSHVKKQAYSVFVKAEDNDPEVPMQDFKAVKITVVAPGPKYVNLQATNKTIGVQWDTSYCPNAIGYYVYRKRNPANQKPDTCTQGVPKSWGYQRIAIIDNKNKTTYIDNSSTLWQGVNYCYVVTAFFADGAESLPSPESCTLLVRGIPAIVKASVVKTDETEGIVHIQWTRATQFDKKQSPGPYKYYIFEGNRLDGKGMSRIDSVAAPDTSQVVFNYYSKKLNTTQFTYTYSIVMYNDGPGKHFEIGASDYASTPYLQLEPSNKKLTLRLQQNVPWTDTTYVIYKQNKVTQLFDSLTSVRDTFYVDKNLINKQNYCYRMKTIGFYSFPELDTVFNYSQINCKAPVDDQPPCHPELNVQTDCYNGKFNLSWTNPAGNECDEDIKYYKVYFAPTEKDKLTLVEQIIDGGQKQYTYTPTLGMAGCFAVTAIDSSENESIIDNKKFCSDICTSNYQLPNIFTPNEDNSNDIFKPTRSSFVVKVDFKVYNRWGVLVFETEDPQINWDGKLKGSNNKVADGVYYYICDVFENRLGGLEGRLMSGFIQVVGSPAKKQ